MAYIQGERELTDLLQHPLVKPLVDTNTLQGLAGGTKVDYILGVVEQAIDRYKDNSTPEAIGLKEKYQHFRDLNPLRYLTHPIPPPSGPKTDAYSARRSMNS